MGTDGAENPVVKKQKVSFSVEEAAQPPKQAGEQAGASSQEAEVSRPHPEWWSDSLLCTRIRLVSRPEQLADDSLFFHPALCHQIFAENEQIFGYKNLSIDITFTSVSFHSCIQISYDSKFSPSSPEDPEPDDLESKLRDKFLVGYETDPAVFTAKYLNSPGANTLAALSTEEEQRSKEVLPGVYKVSIGDPGVVDWLNRCQVLMLFYVDAARYIDTDDNKWTLFIAFDTTKSVIQGYCTVYPFYAHPNQLRLRLSQILVLPPFRRRGLATSMLSSVYKQARDDDSVRDVTIEDPSDDFRMVRDLADVRDVKKSGLFNPVPADLTPEIKTKLRKQLKLYGRQQHVVHDIFRLASLGGSGDSDDTKEKNFRLRVKSRLAVQFEPTINDEDPNKKKENLASLYDEEVERYQTIISKAGL